jgi:hypothetical protein
MFKGAQLYHMKAKIVIDDKGNLFVGGMVIIILVNM